MYLNGGPFLAMRGPFITAAGGSAAPVVTPDTPSVTGTEITFPATSSGSLVGALYGVEFGIGVGAGYVWSESVAGAASSQTITIDIATYGGTTSSVVNAREYYNLDLGDDPSMRVYSAMLAPIVVSASLSGTTTEGETLTGANGIIVGGYQMTLTQSWAACNTAGTSCTPISGQTATTLVLSAAEVGDTIKYTKVATNTAGSGSATSNASAVVISGVSPEAQAVIDEMSPTPGATRQGVIADLVDTLIADGIWAKLDRLWVLAAENDGSAGGTNGRINWIAPGTDNLTLNGAPTWTRNEGYTGDGSGYLDSATNLSAMTHFAEGSACVFAWVLSGSSQTPVMGTSSSINVFLRPSAGGEFGSRVNSTGTLNATNSTFTGLFTSVRKAAGAGTAVEAYIDATSVVTDTRDSDAVAAEPVTVLRALSTNTTNQVSVAGLGSQLSDAEVADLHAALKTYLTAVGALP